MANDQPLTKEAILEAAEQVLRRYGPEKTSVVDVAKALQVSHGTLYRHFPSKAALREAVTERWLHRIAEPLQEIADRLDGSAAERLRTWLQALIQSKRKHVVEDPEMFGMYSAVTLDAVEMIAEHVQHLIGQMTAIIADGVNAKEFRSGEPEAMARAIFFATTRFHHPAHAYEWSTSTIEQEFDLVWELILSGIRK
ncbi:MULTISPECIES: TetR family transcriptional regulator [Paenibacillus]|uniref:TetR family transcriptional regulator n=1 Tax=Paenibacillus violae TaxID=3077234 RepID=A0ABU3RE98_9BACL|nr:MULTISPECIES: TetR family transcriptional regulator [Paenibacillus]MDU0202607.1 TetR family transcriptional regulator [Paenibacillus sp. PFR10]MEC0271204.1 TetR family transcriptional regulator [Paenibacillus anseongense]